VALALAGTLYGPLGISLTAISLAAMIPALHAITVIVLLVYGNNSESDPRALPRILSSLFKNPFIWACIIGVAVQASGITLYTPALTTLDILGRASLALGVLSVGAGLRFPEAFSMDRPVLFTNVVRLAGMPLLMLGYTVLFGVGGPAQAVAIICGAVPCATISYIMARRLGGDAPLMARIASSETLLAMATLPLVLILISWIQTA
jgi:malonate transporter